MSRAQEIGHNYDDNLWSSDENFDGNSERRWNSEPFRTLLFLELFTTSSWIV